MHFSHSGNTQTHSGFSARLRSACCLLLAMLCGIVSAGVAAAETASGEQLFLANCAECHQTNGRGIRNVYPALDGSEVVRGSGVDVALVLIIGRGEMPSFKGALGAAEMAAVINYVRNAWSNEGELVTREAIEALLSP